MSKILYLSFIVLFLAFSFFMGMPHNIIIITSLIMILSLLSNVFIFKKITTHSLLALVIGSAASLLFISIIIFITHLIVSIAGINVNEILQQKTYFAYIFVAFVVAKVYLIFSTTFSFLPIISNILKRGQENLEYAKILDTSVVVDGRIADIAEKGFFDGNLIVPEFVLKEIQALSDSHDTQKRLRGRRALDIVNQMRSSKNVVVTISEVDFPKIKEVDLKLIELSKKMSAKVITNDFNLMKVAEIHGVEILNLNNLANMMYVSVLPGDIITVNLAKEGKEKQALAYLEDGTMIVVDNAKHLIGKDVEIEIGSILPKEAGRVIFATIATNANGKKTRFNNKLKFNKKKYNPNLAKNKDKKNTTSKTRELEDTKTDSDNNSSSNEEQAQNIEENN